MSSKLPLIILLLLFLPLPLLGKEKKQVDLKGTESLMSGTVQMNLTVKAIAGIFAASVSDRVGRKHVLLCGASVSGQARSFFVLEDLVEDMGLKVG